MFANLNLNNNSIELAKEDIQEEVEDNEEDIPYDLGEGYIDFETIEESNNEVQYRR
jgi:hypothetical protein